MTCWRYPCERCSKLGRAHYILVPDAQAPLGWRNELVCTECFELWKRGRKATRAASNGGPQLVLL